MFDYISQVWEKHYVDVLDYAAVLGIYDLCTMYDSFFRRMKCIEAR